MSEERTCLECNNRLLGRVDQKFCSDGCRNTYNNKLNRDNNNLMRNVNNRLRKNHRILNSLNPDQKTQVTKSTLISKGFDFEHFTSIYTTQNGAQYYFIYDLGYFPLGNEKYMLVRKTV